MACEGIAAYFRWPVKLFPFSYYGGKKMRQIVRERILNKCNNKCVKCGSDEKLEVDHIIPLSIGGREDEDNMQILCKKCNRKKYNKAEYNGLIALDENYELYILLNREKCLNILSSKNGWDEFYRHITLVMEEPKKYLSVYGVKHE
jgi:hypothetical protein